MADIRATPVLDDFDRAPEDPLWHGGDWGVADSGAFYVMVLATIGSETMATHPTAASVGSPPNPPPRSSMSAWVDQSFSGDVIEVWGRPVGGNASGIGWSLGLFQQVQGTNQMDGYRFRQGVTTGGGFLRIDRFTNGASTSIYTSPITGFTGATAGDLLLFRRIDAESRLQGYWSHDFGENWLLVCDVTDVTYSGAFYLGMGIADNSVSQILGWGEMGGGVPDLTWMPEFIRRPWEYQGNVIDRQLAT